MSKGKILQPNRAQVNSKDKNDATRPAGKLNPKAAPTFISKLPGTLFLLLIIGIGPILALIYYNSVKSERTTQFKEVSLSKCLKYKNRFIPKNFNAGYNSNLKNLKNSYCYFSSNYSEARDVFAASSVRAHSSMHILPIGKDLSIDISVVKGSSKRVLIHISGTHGPEGFAGSAIQSAALHLISNEKDLRARANLAERNESDPTVIFIHGLNPYGFANNRRVNEDNVDLNRNFLPPDGFDFVLKRDPNFAGYVDIDFFLNPTSQPSSSIQFNDLYGYILMAYAAVTRGIGMMKRALVSGNYHKPKGLGYGGMRLTSSAASLINFVTTRGYLDEAEQVILLDVHTGLGLDGVDTLAVFDSEDLYSLDRVFRTERDAAKGEVIGGIKESIRGDGTGKADALSGYDLTVGTMDDFCREWLKPTLKGRNKLCVTQEFGTLPSIVVGKRLVDENYAFNYGTEEERVVYGERLKEAFYPQRNIWRRKVVHRGLAVFLEAFHFLRGDEYPYPHQTSEKGQQ